jgi:hypothetical protein
MLTNDSNKCRQLESKTYEEVFFIAFFSMGSPKLDHWNLANGPLASRSILSMQ